jgi:hypothetical protein
MIRRLPIWVAGAVALGAAWASAGGSTPAVQLAQLAPNGAPGLVTTLALGEVPPERPIAVTPFADDDLSMTVKARFEAALRQAGRTVAASAPMTLSFETKLIRGRFSRAEGSLGRFEADSGDMRLNLNVWSSSQDSLLGGSQAGAAVSRQANLLHMNAVLRDRETGKILWQGDAYCEMLSSDEARVASSMVAPLTANLGRSIEAQPFDIE